MAAASWTVACHQTAKPRPTKPWSVPHTISGVALYLPDGQSRAYRGQKAPCDVRLRERAEGVGDEARRVEEDCGARNMVDGEGDGQRALAGEELCRGNVA